MEIYVGSLAYGPEPKASVRCTYRGPRGLSLDRFCALADPQSESHPSSQNPHNHALERVRVGASERFGLELSMEASG